ncbi:nineteen complex-related protein 2-domain-containing protein [Mycena metata]|uniref:Nineteen complex-related protein 2-domain-containing protein n=1 Tax=Mycena metata TaxID=1033252 RepID=A0AAD7JTQ8_9AGAR|nr:nineteen complex-related protein 2-domain-containing protein [Mycena metata]
MSMGMGDISADVSMQGVERLDAFELETLIPSEPSKDDFISSSIVKRADESHGPHPESRLMREEDELGEGDHQFVEYTSAQERIAVGKKSRKVQASKRKDAMKEMIADAEETNEEMDE